jgi:hypothetical protein
MACVMEGVKSLVILVHPGSCWRRQIPYRGRTPRFNSNLCRGRGRGAHYCWHHWRGHQGCRSRGQEMQVSRCDRRAGVSEPRLAAFDFQKGRHRIFTRRSGKNRPPVHLVPVPRRDEASYDLDTQLAIATQPGVVATKNGVTLKIVLDAKPKPFWSGHDLPSLCHNQRPQGSS